MFRRLLIPLFLLLLVATPILILITSTHTPSLENAPVAFKGRFRPLDSYSRLWLYDLYHHENIQNKHINDFHLASNESTLDLIWKLHFFGNSSWDDAPLFWVGHASLKSVLELDPKLIHASYNQLRKRINVDNLQITEDLQNLRLALNQYEAIRNGVSIEEAAFNKSWERLRTSKMSSNEIAFSLESQHPLSQRLVQADVLLKMLPSNKGEGIWLPLKALKAKVYDQQLNQLVPVSNFTLYSDEQFITIRKTYLALEEAVLSDKLHSVNTLSEQLGEVLNLSYTELSGRPYLEAAEKSMEYPTLGQLQAEKIYYQYPLNGLAIAVYGIAIVLLALAMRFPLRISSFWGVSVLFLAFFLHTSVLAIRCYILQRPPVSNMFETVIYVPWIAVLASIGLYIVFRNQVVLIASALVAFGLLVLLQITKMSSGLENVQAVLDSQYWLIIHVLMVVGSYGAFALSGMLGHLYLGLVSFQQRESVTAQFIGKCILQTMYAGMIMLVPGTILGGVWAAESWGRFWDWDPKESWAFISICIYLIWIHAYTFHHIRYFGLAVGSIVGLLAISFTWYGVNYILGTGLHSYGFGSGGEIFYYTFLGIEVCYLVWCWQRLHLTGKMT